MIRIRQLLAVALLVPPSFAFGQDTKPAAPVAATPSLTTPLPVDQKVRIGTLPNGIRYYIRQNPKPEKRAELRLVVNAGSILEKPNQLGEAHVVEHTAFNGTTHFAKNDLIKYLESIGVRFGADLNAFTSFDETVYILPVPTDTARIVEQAFTILEDWAHGQTFDSSEVMSERNVVREEWRGRRGAGDRMLQQWLPVAFKGSRYAERLPIGTEQSIMAVTPSRITRVGFTIMESSMMKLWMFWWNMLRRPPSNPYQFFMVMEAPLRSAVLRSTAMRSVPMRSAPLRLVLLRLASVRSA